MTDESPVDRLIPARHIEIKRALCGEGSAAVSPMSDVPVSSRYRRRALLDGEMSQLREKQAHAVRSLSLWRTWAGLTLPSMSGSSGVTLVTSSMASVGE